MDRLGITGWRSALSVWMNEWMKKRDVATVIDRRKVVFLRCFKPDTSKRNDADHYAICPNSPSLSHTHIRTLYLYTRLHLTRWRRKAAARTFSWTLSISLIQHEIRQQMNLCTLHLFANLFLQLFTDCSHDIYWLLLF